MPCLQARHVRASFSPDILQTGAVKGLIVKTKKEKEKLKGSGAQDCYK